jgi:hypothetical protein
MIQVEASDHRIVVEITVVITVHRLADQNIVPAVQALSI